MKDIEALEKGKLIKEALKIVDKLAKSSTDFYEMDTQEAEELEELRDNAKKLTKNRLWKLT